MNEDWRPVTGWEGLYEVSSLARVRSLDRMVRRGSGWYRMPGRVLSQWLDRQGYPCVTLSRDGRTAPQKVHRLVGREFLGECPDGQETRHGPGGRTDSRASELCYGTRLDNAADKIRDGTQLRGSAVRIAKLTEDIVFRCRVRYAAGGITYADLVAETGVSKATLSSALTGKTWKHVPGPLADGSVYRANLSAGHKALAATDAGKAQLAAARHSLKGKSWSAARQAAQQEGVPDGSSRR